MADRNKRPIAPLVYGNEEEHRRLIATRANSCLPKDGSEGMTYPLLLKSLAVADLTGAYAASLWTGAMVYVTDETGGAIPCFSDGTNWRRVSDRAVAS